MYTIRSYKAALLCLAGWVRMLKKKSGKEPFGCKISAVSEFFSSFLFLLHFLFSLSCLIPSPFLLDPHASGIEMSPANQWTIVFKTKRETEKNPERLDSLDERSFNYASCSACLWDSSEAWGWAWGARQGRSCSFSSSSSSLNIYRSWLNSQQSKVISLISHSIKVERVG